MVAPTFDHRAWRAVQRTAVRASLAWALVMVVGGCGGSAPTQAPPPTPPPAPPAPATLADLSASLTSPDAGQTLSCTEDVHVAINLTNRSGSPVTVTGIHKTSATQSRECFAGPEFTYQAAARTVLPNSTNTVFNQALYTNGTGCCDNPRKCGGTCDFEQTFDVVTPLGSVPAGTFTYYVAFSSACRACGTSTAAGGSCPSPSVPSR